MSGYHLVHVTSSNLRKELPEFEGILYKARDEPVEGELTYTSEDCAQLDLRGYPICVEHNNGAIKGSVGVIVESSFRKPDLMIKGVVNTPHVRVREEIRSMLRSGELTELSIGFVGLKQPDGTYSHKLFKEASLVGGGFYSGTRLVSVQASGKNAGEGVQREGSMVVDSESDMLQLLEEKRAENTTKKTAAAESASPTQDAERSYISNSKTTGNSHEATGHAQAVRVTSSNLLGTYSPTQTPPDQQQAIAMDQPQQADQQQASSVDQADTAADEQQVASPGDAPPAENMDVGDIDGVDTDGKTRQEAINAYREAFERTQKMSAEQLAAAKRDAGAKEAELEELRAFKRSKIEEYKKAQEAPLARVHGILDKAGLADAKDVYTNVAASPEFKSVWESTKYLARESEAKDAEIAEMKKKLNALKRKQSSMSGVAAADTHQQAVAVKSARVNTMGGNSMYGARAMSGAQLYDVLRNKSSSQAPASDSRRPVSNDMPTGGAPQDFGNQHVTPMNTDDVSEHLEQFAAQQQHMQQQLRGGGARQQQPTFVRPVHEQVYAQCSRAIVESMAEKEAYSRMTPFFKNSMREVAPDLFDQLLAMPRSGSMPVIDDSVVDRSLMNKRFSTKSANWGLTATTF